MTSKVLASDSATTKKWLVTAKHNTWSHQRRKRRQIAQLASREKLDKLENIDNESCDDRLQQQETANCGSTDGVVINGGQLGAGTVHSESCVSDKHPVTELDNGDVSAGKDINVSGDGAVNSCVTTEKPCHIGGTGTAEKCGENVRNKDMGDGECLMKYTLAVSQQKDCVVLQFTWREGVSYDLLHQVVQYFRNRLQ